MQNLVKSRKKSAQGAVKVRRFEATGATLEVQRTQYPGRCILQRDGQTTSCKPKSRDFARTRFRAGGEGEIMRAPANNIIFIRRAPRKEKEEKKEGRKEVERFSERS